MKDKISFMEKDQLKKIVEALLFISADPVPLKKFSSVLKISESEVNTLISELKEEYNNKTKQISEIANGLLLHTRKEYSSWIR